MAYLNTTRTGSLTLADRIGGLLKSVKLAAERRAVFTRTVRELDALSDRDLTDLGIHRSMIRELAREAAYGQ